LININATLIWYESPKRLLGFLKDLKLVFGNRKAVIVKELTKLYEEVLRDDLFNLITEIEKRKRLKGEYVVVVEKPFISKTKFVNDDIKNQINTLLETKPLRSVVETLVNKTNLPKNVIYNAALEIKNSKPIN
jgi:16S rRNA (cytidine1402-2'-O)-methyltransferase